MPKTTRREFLAATVAAGGARAAVRPWNFIVILVDDWGATDLGCYGSRFYETPHIDRLAAEGMRFTQAYSACTVCSPSRAAVMTGKYPARLHVTDWIAGHQYPRAKLKPPAWTQHLELSEVTVAEALRPKGYATASIGKWHLGGPEFYPEHQGFDRNVAGSFRGSPPRYFSPYGIETLKDGPAGEYLTTRECTEALAFMEERRNGPFFVYLPHHAVHNPLQGLPDLVEKYERKAAGGQAQGKPVYAAMVEGVDRSVGRILDKLREWRIEDRTVVILTSDNGGLINNTRNLGLRAGKGSAYEGGVRAPFIVRWPGVTRPGSICAVPVMGIDIHPTLREIAGGGSGKVDGVSLVPLLRGGGRLERDTLYWHYPHYHPGGATPYSAIRAGDLRLVEFQEDGRVELYDLKEDPEESRDLAGAMPEKARELRARLERWRRDVGAQMAVPNPDYDPARPMERGQGARKR